MEDKVKKLKAIADKNRYKIVKILLNNSYCVRGLSNLLEISESAVSQHLKILREAEIVVGEKKGYFVHYRVKKENIEKIAEIIKELIQ